MVLAAPVDRATILDRNGRRWMLCGNCRKTMGELVGVRLVVITHGRTLTFPATPGLRQTCAKCGQESEYRGDVLSS